MCIAPLTLPSLAPQDKDGITQACIRLLSMDSTTKLGKSIVKSMSAGGKRGVNLRADGSVRISKWRNSKKVEKFVACARGCGYSTLRIELMRGHLAKKSCRDKVDKSFYCDVDRCKHRVSGREGGRAKRE